MADSSFAAILCNTVFVNSINPQRPYFPYWCQCYYYYNTGANVYYYNLYRENETYRCAYIDISIYYLYIYTIVCTYILLYIKKAGFFFLLSFFFHFHFFRLKQGNEAR